MEAIRKQLETVLHKLTKQKGCQIVEGYWKPDHVHMCIGIHRGTRGIKGKSAISVTRKFKTKMSLRLYRR